MLLLALGLGPMVASIDSGGLDNKLMVLGYVVMRVGAIILWLRVARVSERYRVMATAYVRALVISQVGWCLQAFLPLPPRIGLTVMAVWLVQEVLYPVLAERRQQMPWHPEHMAERLGAFTIITLGEVVLGTVTAVQADVDEFGWNATAVAVAVSGLGLAFGLWWLYFILPCGELLGLRPRRLHAVILLHILLYASIAAVGAGLHLSASFVEGESGIPRVALALAVAVPATAAVLLTFANFTTLLGGFDVFHGLLLALTVGVAACGVALAGLGVPLGVDLALLMLIPWLSVVGYELRGHRTMSHAVARAKAALGVPRPSL